MADLALVGNGVELLPHVLHAAHEPVLTIARKLAYKALQPTSTPMVMLLYFAIPLGVIGVLLLAQALLRRCLPGVARVINGGRA